jgi:hypothetical protein
VALQRCAQAVQGTGEVLRHAGSSSSGGAGAFTAGGGVAGQGRALPRVLLPRPLHIYVGGEWQQRAQRATSTCCSPCSRCIWWVWSSCGGLVHPISVFPARLFGCLALLCPCCGWLTPVVTARAPPPPPPRCTWCLVGRRPVTSDHTHPGGLGWNGSRKEDGGWTCVASLLALCTG